MTPLLLQLLIIRLSSNRSSSQLYVSISSQIQKLTKHKKVVEYIRYAHVIFPNFFENGCLLTLGLLSEFT